MPKLIFRPSELREVGDLCERFDPATDVRMSQHLSRIKNPWERQELANHLREWVRGELIAGLIARAAGNAAIDAGIASAGAVKGMTSDDYACRYDHSKFGFRESIWQYNLGRVGDDYMRVLELFNTVYGKNGAWLRDMYSLLDRTHEAMFGKPYAEESERPELESV